MRSLKLAAIAVLVSIAGCYVSTTPTYYAHRPVCPYGYYWNGYRCRA